MNQRLKVNAQVKIIANLGWLTGKTGIITSKPRNGEWLVRLDDDGLEPKLFRAKEIKLVE